MTGPFTPRCAAPSTSGTVRAVVALALLLPIARPAAGQDSTYVGHPRLLFTAADVDSLRAKLHDGGDDDSAYVAIRTWADGLLGQPATSFLGSWEGLNTVGPLGLLSVLEPDGSAYASKLRELILWLVHNRSVDNDEFASSLRLHAMALGYDMAFADAAPSERTEVRQEMRAYLDYMQPHFNYYCNASNPYCGNHGMTVGAAIGLATLALWDDVSTAGRDSLTTARTFGDAIVTKTLADVLAADGSYREGVLYGGWIVRVAAPYFEARRRFDGFDFAADPRLHRMIAWLCYELSPDGTGRTLAFNDSPWSTRPLALHNTVIQWAEMRWADPLAGYLQQHVVGFFGFDYEAYADRLAAALWGRPVAAVNPASILRDGGLFPARGLYIYRSGWMSGAGGDEVVFGFFSGRYYGGHAQEDQNQFVLSGYGKQWVVDCGAASTAAPMPKQTEAHNLVLVDGLGQHNAGSSIGTDGAIAATLLSGFADYVRGDASAAYATYSSFNAPGVPFPFSDWSWGYDGGNPLERADRLCLVVKGPQAPPYVLVADDIRKDGSLHTYDWLLHTDAGNTIDLQSTPATLTAGSASCDLYFAHPANPLLSWSLFQHGGVDPATHRIQAEVDDVEPRFFVALVPRGTGMAAPTYGASSDSLSSTLSIDWGTVRDTAVFDPYGVPVAGEVSTDGRLACVRESTVQVTRWLLAEGTFLHHGATSLAWFSAPASASCAGDTVHLSRADVAFDAWAPEATVVIAPTGPVPYTRAGAFVRSPTSASEALPVPPTLSVHVTSMPRGANRVRLRLRAPSSTRVRLRILDVRGRLVTTLVDGPVPAGTTSIDWGLADARGVRVASGVYVAVAEAPVARATCKIVLTR